MVGLAAWAIAPYDQLDDMILLLLIFILADCIRNVCLYAQCRNAKQTADPEPAIAIDFESLRACTCRYSKSLKIVCLPSIVRNQNNDRHVIVPSSDIDGIQVAHATTTNKATTVDGTCPYMNDGRNVIDLILLQ